MLPSPLRGFLYKGDNMRTFLAALAFASLPCFAQAACMAVEDDPAITVSDSQLASLAEISFTRKELFEALQATSEFETSGCWAAPVGNFDAQTLSVGILQWNYGQNSLQELMKSYRAAFPAPEAFDAEIATLMPTYAATAFSEECLSVPFATSCKEKILAAHDEQGKLSPTIAAEYEALFNSTPMRQVQVAQFVDFLSAMKPKLNQMFGQTPTSLQTRWGIDLAIQQGYAKYTDSQTGLEQTAYLNPTDAASVRRLASALTPIQRRNRMMSSLRWYSGLCGGIYQGVVSEQCNYNIKHWCAVVMHGVSDEQFDLFNLTYVRSRIATGQSGRWQANAFARRTKIVLGTGQVGPRKLELPRGVRKTRRCNSMLIRD
jgi:hypothetical protein